MVAFILVSNYNERSAFTHGMYNDQTMMLYIMITIYLTLTNRPLLAAFFYTLGLSVKAGVLLMLPSFLGSIHMNYGTVNLIKSVIIIVSF